MKRRFVAKNLLRAKFLNKRLEFSEADVTHFSAQIFKNFIAHFSLENVENIHCFLPLKKFNEIDTSLFIEFFWQKNKSVYVPKIVGDGLLSLKFETSTILEKNRWGVPEPSIDTSDFLDLDLVLVPLVYCDPEGNRIGYGKGFYDRFFQKITKNPLKIGLSIFTPTDFIFDVFEEDIKLDYLVTPTEVLSFFAGISKSTK